MLQALRKKNPKRIIKLKCTFKRVAFTAFLIPTSLIIFFDESSPHSFQPYGGVSTENISKRKVELLFSQNLTYFEPFCLKWDEQHAGSFEEELNV